MIEKIFEQSRCVSCAKETPVIFIAKDILGHPLYRIPLCRECSDKFAEDKINHLKGKLEKKRTSNVQLKCKVKQMNVISSKHKKVITELYNKQKELGND